MDYDQVLRLLIGTRMGERLASIQQLYSRLDHEQARFKEHFCINCKEGCGTCCEHFNPDITTLEADYIAVGLIYAGRDEEVLRQLHEHAGWDHCPLYRPDNPFHCSIYALRPLVCRLFGASAVKDKNGKPTFRNCRWNEHTHELSTEELESAPDSLVLMGDYGLQLDELQIEDTATYPLSEAIERSIYKIRFLIQLESDPEPEPNAS